MVDELTGLDRINNELVSGWTARLTTEGRIYYINHPARSTQWVPPRENWTSRNSLPHGWEEGVNRTGKSYYINHVRRKTSSEDPCDDAERNGEGDEDDDDMDDSGSESSPHPRDVELTRDDDIGFGFVAGSEKPVIVRFVTEDGPSRNKLLPGDHILAINGEDVSLAAREHVIQLVKSCDTSMSLTVCQPQTDNSQRKSALLTAAKRARLKNNPSRVRFAEAVVVNSSGSNGNNESYVPFMPNVLKVFLENGQTKSFKYDASTTVRDVLNSMQQKLGITCIEHFALVLQNSKGVTQNKMMLLRETESLAEIASQPGSQHFRCLFRVAFVPHDAYDMLRKDTTAFEYFYTQCCNDLLKERLSSDIKYDVAMRLAALRIQEHMISNHASPNKVSIKALAKEPGLDHFLPLSLLNSSKGKDVRKMLSHYLRASHSLTAPGQKQLTALQAKLHYLKIVGELKTFGAKSFIATFVERKIEVMLSVGHRHGICLVANIKNNRLTELAQFQQLAAVRVEAEGESMLSVQLQLLDPKRQPITLLMLTDDASDLVAMVNGYYHLFVDANKSLVIAVPPSESNDEVPVYSGRHRVIAESWSYPNDLVTEVITETNDAGRQGSNGSSGVENERFVDLSKGPPIYEENGPSHIAKIKEELGLQVGKAIVSESAPLNDGRSGNAPLASPDTSTLSGSSDSTDPSETTTVIASLSSPCNTSAASVFVDVTKNSGDSCGGSTLTLVDANPDDVAKSTINGRKPATTNHTIASPNGAVTSGSKFITNSLVSWAESNGSSAPPTTSPELTTYISTFSAANASDLAKRLGSQDDLDPDVTLLQSESDDTDAMSTPTNSPARGHLQLGLRPVTVCLGSDTSSSTSTLKEDESFLRRDTFANRSFGLCSPDKSSLAERMHPSYNPRLFVDGGLYLDPDIIDLTLLPPPKTPDFEAAPCLLELPSPGSAAAPPPGFSDAGSSLPDRTLNTSSDSLPAFIRDLPTAITEKIDALVMNDEDLVSQMAAIDELLLGAQPEDRGKESGIESESDSGNETISCENVDASNAAYQELLADAPSDTFPQGTLPMDLNSLDIDSFIASVAVPPPPKDDSVGDSQAACSSNGAVCGTAVIDRVEASPSVLCDVLDEQPLWRQLLDTMPMSHDLEEEFAKLVTPPPPSSTKLCDIPIVPPVGAKTPSPVLGESSILALHNGTPEHVVPVLDLTDSDVRLSSPAVNKTNSEVILSSTATAEYKRSVSASDVERVGSRPRSKPPIPPKRFSSLDANSTSSSSTPASSPRGSIHSVEASPGAVSQNDIGNIENLQQRLRFWRPTEVSKPCCSPTLPNGIHPNLAQNGDSLGQGSLTRPKKKPPPPPPRRSSMLGKVEENVDGATVVIAANGCSKPTNGSIATSPVNCYSPPIYSNTMCTSPGQIKSPNSNGDSSPLTDNQLKPQISASILERQQAIQSCFRPDVEYVAIKTNLPKSPTVARSNTFTQPNSDSKLQPYCGATSTSSLQKHSSFSHTAGDGQRRFQTFFSDDATTTSGSSLGQTTTSVKSGVTSHISNVNKQQHARRISDSLTALSPPAPSSRSVHARSSSMDLPRKQTLSPDIGSKIQPGSDDCMAGVPRKGLAPWHSTCERKSTSTSTLSSAQNSTSFKARSTSTSQVSVPSVAAAARRTMSSPSDPPTDSPPAPPGGSGLLSRSLPVRSASGSSAHDNTFVISPEEVIDKTYIGAHTLTNANRDVDALLLVISESIRSSNSSASHNRSCVCDASEFAAFKVALVAEARQFVTDSKLLVSSATQSREKLVGNINTSMHTLAKIVRQMHAVMTVTSGTATASLGMKVKDVAMSYRSTVNAAHNAAGKPLSDPSMKQLMRQATALASKLSALMRTLKTIENR